MLGYYITKRSKIDPEILPILDRFNEAGYFTESSCQGHYDLDKSLSVGEISYKIPYIIFEELSTSDIQKVIKGIDELKLITIKLEYSVFPKENQYHTDFTECDSVHKYADLIKKIDNQPSCFKVYFKLNPAFLHFSDKADVRSHCMMFDEIREKFIHEVDLLSMYLLLRREKYDKD